MHLLLAGLHLSYTIYKYTDCLSQSLQSVSLSGADGSEMAKSVVARTAAEFGNLYEKVLNDGRKLGESLNGTGGWDVESNRIFCF